jgi:ankyrin repeat protein
VRLFAEREKTLLNYPNKDECTALHLAAVEGDEEVVRYLLEKGADPDKKDKNGSTPDSLASSNSHAGIKKNLLAVKVAKIKKQSRW